MAKLIAHRGASKEKKQNTLAAFEYASKTGVFGVETDIRITRDGVFVAFHDKSAARLSGRYKIIEETDFKEVQKLKVYDRHLRHKVPTLQDYLGNCKSNGKIAVAEVKSPLTKEQTDRLIDAIAGEQYLGRTIFISFNKKVLEYIRARLPEQPIQLLALRYRQDELKYLQEFNFGIDIYHKQLTRERIDEYHELGIEVNCWTVNRRLRARQLTEWCVDYITTDKHKLLGVSGEPSPK